MTDDLLNLMRDYGHPALPATPDTAALIVDMVHDWTIDREEARRSLRDLLEIQRISLGDPATRKGY